MTRCNFDAATVSFNIQNYHRKSKNVLKILRQTNEGIWLDISWYYSLVNLKTWPHLTFGLLNQLCSSFAKLQCIVLAKPYLPRQVLYWLASWGREYCFISLKSWKELKLPYPCFQLISLSWTKKKFRANTTTFSHKMRHISTLLVSHHQACSVSWTYKLQNCWRWDSKNIISSYISYKCNF
jgi:hypothetical protein